MAVKRSGLGKGLDSLIPDTKMEKKVIKPVVKEEKKFTISPVISPIYGLQKSSTSDLELENTADYDKLDEEIKKTNDFLTTLKDLQNKLDENN